MSGEYFEQPQRTWTSSQFASSQLRKCTLTQNVLCSTLAPGISLILQSGDVYASCNDALPVPAQERDMQTLLPAAG